MDSTALLLGLLFSSIGFGYFLYGRKQSMIATKYTGITLMVMPYFLQDSTPILIAGILLLLAPRVIERLMS